MNPESLILQKSGAKSRQGLPRRARSSNRKLLILHGLLVSVRQEYYVNRKAIMLITGDLQDLSADFQRAEISSGTHTHRIVPY